VSTDETGGMYVVSTHALYRLDATASGQPEITWREVYDRGTRLKPGNLSQGSGTTPTLLGDRWVAINDNADPQTQILVYDRRNSDEIGSGADRLHCAVPVLPANAGTTDNSLVAAGGSFIIENNYGYKGPQSTILGLTTTPGLARVMVDDNGCHVAWTNDSIAPTSVAKASLGNGLLYAYTKPKLPPVLGYLIDAWYFTAIDIRTGKTVWSRLTGTGIQWNNHYAAIYLGPDGTAYVATLAGLVRIKDA
jgi:outer membrane protein assembly factor BamB